MRRCSAPRHRAALVTIGHSGYHRAVIRGSTKTSQASDYDSGSLGAAIEMVARSAGVEIDSDVVSAMMGWPWLICAGADESCPRTWHRLARDAFFIEAGPALGLSLRELHPPRAARGLDGLAEFPQHFDASYKPLILRALEHRQPVILAATDPDGNAPTWRVILPEQTSTDDALTRSLSTTAPAPTQVYVVERMSQSVADFDQLLTVTLDHARRALSGEVDRSLGVVTGPRACDRWIRSLSDNKPCPSCGKAIESCLTALAGAIAGEHVRLIRFLDAHRGGVPDETRRLVATIETTSRDVIASLGGQEPASTIPQAVAAIANLRASLVRLLTALDARALVAPR